MTRLHRWYTATLLGFMFLGLSTISQGYEAITGPTGVLYYDQAKAYDGYTLFTPCVRNKTTYLMDNEGNIVHTWKSEYDIGAHSELLPNGNLLRGGVIPTEKVMGEVGIGAHGGILEEFDWDGKKVWEYKLHIKGKELQHHSFARLPNGNTMILAWEAVSKEDMIKMGRDPKSIPTKPVISLGYPHNQFWVDFIREVNREGKTVWEYHVKDHFGKGEKKFDINYQNSQKIGIEANLDYSHLNSVAYDPKTDTVLLSSRNLGEFYLINHKTGEMKYRWGNPTAWDPKAKKPTYYDDGDQQMFGNHNATFLKNGNILILDNGSERPQLQRSRSLEVDPKSGEIVWQFFTQQANSFSTHRQGGTQRLANGNTFITSAHGGHLFEVTKEGQVVWEFVSPISKGKVKAVLNDTDAMPAKFHMSAMMNFVHRASRYGKDYPAFYDKDLTSQGYIGGDDSPRFYRDYHAGANISAAAPSGKTDAAKAAVDHDAPAAEEDEATMNAY